MVDERDSKVDDLLVLDPLLVALRDQFEILDDLFVVDEALVFGVLAETLESGRLLVPGDPDAFAHQESGHLVLGAVGDDFCVGVVLVSEGDILELDLLAFDFEHLVQLEFGDYEGSVGIFLHRLACGLQRLHLGDVGVRVYIFHLEDLFLHVTLLFFGVGRVVVLEFDHLDVQLVLEGLIFVFMFKCEGSDFSKGLLPVQDADLKGLRGLLEVLGLGVDVLLDEGVPDAERDASGQQHGVHELAVMWFCFLVFCGVVRTLRLRSWLFF